MAGHSRRDMVEHSFETIGRIMFGNFIGQIADELLHVHFAQHGGRFTDCDSTGAKLLYAKPEFCQRFGMRGEPFGILFGKIDDFWNKQHLPCDRTRMQRVLQGFIDKPFVCRVLINDHKTVLGLRDDIIFVNLSACRTQRLLHLLDRRFSDCRARIGNRHCYCCNRSLLVLMKRKRAVKFKRLMCRMGRLRRPFGSWSGRCRWTPRWRCIIVGCRARLKPLCTERLQHRFCAAGCRADAGL